MPAAEAAARSGAVRPAPRPLGQRLLDATETVAALLLLAVALLTAANVLLRGALSIQIPDWFDLSRMLQLIALFWGIAVTTYRGRHICVDAVWERLSARGRRRMDLVATAITLVVLVPLVWMIWSKVGAVGTQTTSDLRLPLVWFFAAGAVGVTMAAVLCVRRLQELARGS